MISVIVPTYNRFRYLMNTIASIKRQTYKNIEIIVINDGSLEKEYYEYEWGAIKIIHLEENSKEKFGYPCVGYVINQGIKIMKGDYFTTCDDDDIWFPKKLELQLQALKETGCKMCCTEGISGEGIYNPAKKYKKYLTEINFEQLRRIYGGLFFRLPKIWNYRFIKKHNCIIACSVMIHKDIIKKIGLKLEIKMGGDVVNNQIVHTDWEYWLRALKYTNCVYVKDVCIYYDNSHGDGINY